MKKTQTQSSRRGFLTGMLAGLGVATAAVAAGSSKAKAAQPDGDTPKGQVLYHRSAETERYFKTL
ncbi:MAG: twin-arginine translocation pathway signal protein [bacterium]